MPSNKWSRTEAQQSEHKLKGRDENWHINVYCSFEMGAICGARKGDTRKCWGRVGW